MTATRRRRARQVRPVNTVESSFFWTDKEMAAQLGFTPQTLRLWRKQGIGPPWIRNSPRSIVYLKDSVHEWMKKAERRVQVAEPRRKPGPKATPIDGSDSRA